MVEVDFGHGLRALAKLEGCSEARSHKLRAAKAVVASMMSAGVLGRTGRTLLLSSSGRAAIAFASATASIPGVKLIVLSDVLSPAELLSELDDFPHVEKIVVNDPDRSGSHLNARLRRLEELKVADPNAVVIDQYGDPRFPEAYFASLIPEVIEQAASEISAIFVPTGTGALIRAFDMDKQRNSRRWRIVPVDAEGSALFRNPPRGSRRRFSGYGNARPTSFIEACRSIERPIHVPDLAVARVAPWLAQKGLCVGPSSAAAAAAFLHAAFVGDPTIHGPGMAVLVLPDHGGAYTNSLFNKAWLDRQGMGRTVQ